MRDHSPKKRIKITLINLQNNLTIHPGKIKNLILKVIQNEKGTASGRINICFTDNRKIKEFNAKFHKTNSATDVLAFNLSDKNNPRVILADIMVSTQTAIKQAIKYRTNPDYELSLYVVHGLLHILGFNDQSLKQIKLMRKKESQYVN